MYSLIKNKQHESRGTVTNGGREAKNDEMVRRKPPACFGLQDKEATGKDQALL